MSFPATFLPILFKIPKMPLESFSSTSISPPSSDVSNVYCQILLQAAIQQPKVRPGRCRQTKITLAEIDGCFNGFGSFSFAM